MTAEAARARVEKNDWKPRNCVWELTLACNLRCTHCGSRAGRPRPDELSLEACLDVADQLADLGCELVSLSGGEPTLKAGWDQIARRLKDRGVIVNMVTNGAYPSAEAADDIARRAVAAGMANVGVSVDGPPAIHDQIRGVGAFARTMRGIEAFKRHGLSVAVMTTVDRRNLAHLTEVRQLAMDAGARMWRLQLNKPMGAMDDHRAVALAPTDLLTLLPKLAELKRQGGIHLAVGDSLGYYGPHDQVLRGQGWRGRKECWQGCQAGMQAIGIEADGGVKGCLSLQAKLHGGETFVEGSLATERLSDIWHKPGAFAYNRDPEALTGFCASCGHAKLCRGGARCVSAAFLGVLTEDPFCWYRVDQESRRRRLSRPMVAAAMVLGLGAVACDDDDDTSGKTDTGAISRDGSTGDATAREDAGSDATQTDAATQTDYGVIPPTDAATQTDYGVIPPTDAATQTDYGVPPDAAMHTDYGVPPDFDAGTQTDYGVPPDAAIQTDYGVPPRDAGVQTDYGVPPDAGAIDCSAVCCLCDYGVLPDEVYETCCAPCERVCCDCDYGEPPPPQCCP